MARVWIASRWISMGIIYVGSREVKRRVLDSNTELLPRLVDSSPFVYCFRSLVSCFFDSKFVCTGRVVVRDLHRNLILRVRKSLFVTRRWVYDVPPFLRRSMVIDELRTLYVDEYGWSYS